MIHLVVVCCSILVCSIIFYSIYLRPNPPFENARSSIGKEISEDIFQYIEQGHHEILQGTSLILILIILLLSVFSLISIIKMPNAPDS